MTNLYQRVCKQLLRFRTHSPKPRHASDLFRSGLPWNVDRRLREMRELGLVASWTEEGRTYWKNTKEGTKLAKRKTITK